MTKYVLVTGGFDPLHSGHIEYFKAAKKIGDRLVVGLNSDEWLTRKKGRPFMTFNERASIIKELKMVDQVIKFNDDDDTACHAIYSVLSMKLPNDTLIFANGGDRNNKSTPEYEMYKHQYGLEFVWGVGGEDKKNSSSWLLDEWKTQKTERDWGYWRVLDDKKTIKTKELVINPECSLSDQRHQYRTEYWYILKGNCEIITECNNFKEKVHLKENDHYIIEKGVWHKTTNNSSEPCYILEVQHGEMCVEDDIERRD